MATRLTRSSDDKMIAGVCTGIARYLHMDVPLVRILFVVLTIFGLGVTGVVVYAALIVIMPEDGAPAGTPDVPRPGAEPGPAPRPSYERPYEPSSEPTDPADGDLR